MKIKINDKLNINSLKEIDKFNFLNIFHLTSFEELKINNLSNFEINMLFRKNILNIIANNHILPNDPIFFLNDQLQELDENFDLELLFSKLSVFWIGLPFFNPNELLFSATVGCVSIIKELRTRKIPVFGLFPFFSSSKICNEHIYNTSNALCSMQKKIGIIGGDHKVTWTFLNQIHKISQKKEIIYFHIDAHTDLYGFESFNSSNINHANFLIDLFVNKIISQAILFGCRDSIENFKTMQTNNFNIHGIYETYLDFSKNNFNFENSHIHLSIDIDILDPKFAPSVSNPIQNGWSLDKLKQTVKSLLDNINFDSFSIVEVCNNEILTISSAIEIIDLITSHSNKENLE